MKKAKMARAIGAFMKCLLRGNKIPLSSWTLFHQINKASMFYGLSPEDLAEKNYIFILTIKGVDDTSSQELRARKNYGCEQILWGRQYVDILHVADDGAITLDYRDFHKTRPDKNES